MNHLLLKFEAELDAVIARQLSSSVVIAMVIAGLMAAALWTSFEYQIAYWLIALLSVSFLRLGFGYFPGLTAYEKRVQLPLTLITALIWGASAPLFLSALDVEQQMLLILVLIGIVAGSSNSYAGRMSLFYAFMLPILIPLASWLFLQGGQTYTTVGLIIVLYILALSIYTKRNTELLKTSIMQNNQLADEVSLRKAHEQRLELQQRVLDAIARHRGSLNDILHVIVQQVEAYKTGMSASILLLAEDQKQFKLGVSPSLPDEWNAKIDGLETAPAAGAFRNARVITSDIASDPLWQGLHDTALASDLKACWSEPVCDAKGALLGVFSMYFADIRQPSDEELRFLEHIASLTSIAIDNYYNRIKLDAARQQQAELMDTVKHSSDLIYVYDLGGVISSANAASKLAFGDEIVGKNIASIIAPDHLQLVRTMIQQKIDTGENTVYEIDVIDFHGLRHHLEINSSPIVRDGKTVAISGIARDITERKKAEAQLALLVQAIDACHESIIVLNAEGEIEFANPAAAALYQQPLRQMMGVNAALLRGGSIGDATYRDILSCIKQGNVWSGDLRFQQADKDDRLIARRISPISDEQGHVHHQICIDRDITEATQRNQQMEHTQRLESLGLMAGGIAHDFNNLLTIIIGNTDIAEQNLAALKQSESNSTQFKSKQLDSNQRVLNRIRESSQQAAALCKQMLDYAGKGRFLIEAINVSTLIQDMVRLMEVSIGKHVSTDYVLNNNLPLINADPSQLQQVILNLITNANEAIAEQHGEIVFRTGLMQATRAELAANCTNEKLEAGDYVYIEVSDNGCGMDAATIEKMFDPFFTTKFVGRGLGMSSMMGIVRAHHGAIFVSSQPGEGSTFRILLPLKKNVQQQREKVQPVQASSGKEKALGIILIIDDEQQVREISAALLKRAGFDTLEACDGAEAVEIYCRQQAEISAVLLDMTMPKMDGKTCLGKLKDINPDVKVLLASGYSEQKISEIFNQQAPAGFIQKPYMPGSLQQQIKQIID